MSASPTRALFEPSAVLSSTKALFPRRSNSEEAAIVVICPLTNSIAEVLEDSSEPGHRSRRAEARDARGHVEKRLVGLAPLVQLDGS